MKLYKAYTNEDLLNHLRGSKEVINGLTDFDLDDEQLEVINRYKNLSQFERDLLYLYSQHTVDIISKLYNCSKTHIYNKLREIKKKLWKP